MRTPAKKKLRLLYFCPFCKKDIVASSKTEIHYRNHWINGCNDCFTLSISEATAFIFQKKDYQI